MLDVKGTGQSSTITFFREEVGAGSGFVLVVDFSYEILVHKRRLPNTAAAVDKRLSGWLCMSTPTDSRRNSVSLRCAPFWQESSPSRPHDFRMLIRVEDDDSRGRSFIITNKLRNKLRIQISDLASGKTLTGLVPSYLVDNYTYLDDSTPIGVEDDEIKPGWKCSKKTFSWRSPFRPMSRAQLGPHCESSVASSNGVFHFWN